VEISVSPTCVQSNIPSTTRKKRSPHYDNEESTGAYGGEVQTKGVSSDALRNSKGVDTVQGSPFGVVEEMVYFIDIV
jgi:hypothetical protein